MSRSNPDDSPSQPSPGKVSVSAYRGNSLDPEWSPSVEARNPSP